MSSGEQTCQHLPRDCPGSPGALTQLTGGARGCHPSTGLPSKPAWLTLTPSAQVCSLGLLDKRSFCSDTRIAFVSHDCLWLADCFPRRVIAGKARSMSWGYTRAKRCQIWQFVELFETPVDSCMVWRQGSCVLWKNKRILLYIALRWRVRDALLSWCYHSVLVYRKAAAECKIEEG